MLLEQILGEALNLRTSSGVPLRPGEDSTDQVPGEASWFVASSFSEVHSKSIFEKDRRDWLVIPDAIAAYIYESVNKISPKVGQFLMDAAQAPVVTSTRYGKILCGNTAIAMAENRGRSGRKTRLIKCLYGKTQWEMN